MSHPTRFVDRHDAGEQLADALSRYAARADAIVLALPRGGVPVGYTVAQRLGLPFDIILVRKLGLPSQPEYAMGAIASGGVRVLNAEATDGLAIPSDVIDATCARESAIIREREHLYRGDRPAPDLQGRCAIVVDDGLATGSTMRAAFQVVRRQGAAYVVGAVPIGAPESCELLASEADEMLCLSQPHHFRAVSQWYSHFDQTSDDEVRHLLMLAWHGTPPPARPPPQRGDRPS